MDDQINRGKKKPIARLDTDGVGDTPEMISTCLHCPRDYCVNCFRSKTKGPLSEKDKAKVSWTVPPFDKRIVTGNAALARAVYENYCSGLTDRESSDMLGLSVNQVFYLRTRLGLKRMPKYIQRELRIMKGLT